MSLTISLTPLEVERRLATLGIPCRFTNQEHTTFATTAVVDPALGRVFSFTTPVDNSPLTLANIRNCVGTDPAHPPSIFDHPWYQNEDFMRVPCSPGRHFIMMDVLPDSIQQAVNYLDSSGKAGLGLPSAVEVVLMLFLHYVGTGEKLLMKKHTWCSDTASLERHVTVGAFGRNGVFLSGHPSQFTSQGLGICAKLSGL